MEVNWAALAPLVAAGVAFVGFCLYDIAQHDVRYLPKWVWVIICCASIPVGGIIYLLAGRDPASRGR
jgi:hypothetical protein